MSYMGHLRLSASGPAQRQHPILFVMASMQMSTSIQSWPWHLQGKIMSPKRVYLQSEMPSSYVQHGLLHWLRLGYPDARGLAEETCQRPRG